MGGNSSENFLRPPYNSEEKTCTKINFTTVFFSATSSSFFTGKTGFSASNTTSLLAKVPACGLPSSPVSPTVPNMVFFSLPSLAWRERGNDAFSSLFSGTALPYLGDLAGKKKSLPGSFQDFLTIGAFLFKITLAVSQKNVEGVDRS